MLKKNETRRGGGFKTKKEDRKTIETSKKYALAGN